MAQENGSQEAEAAATKTTLAAGTTIRRGSPGRPRASTGMAEAPPVARATPIGNGSGITPARTIVMSSNGHEDPSPSSGPPMDLRFRLARIGPWSVFKLAMIFSFGAMLIVLGALGVLYILLDASGVLASIEKAVNQYGIVHHFRIDAGWIFTRLAWLGVLMVVLGSLVATCLTWFYNAVSDATSGLDVSLEPFDREPQPTRHESRYVQRRTPRKPVRFPAMVLGLPTRNGNSEQMDDAAGF
jgi:hypothetical protein